jgi:hypothetical protein
MGRIGERARRSGLLQHRPHIEVMALCGPVFRASSDIAESLNGQRLSHTASSRPYWSHA